MNGWYRQSLLMATLFLVLIALSAAAGNTYINDFPNVEVTEPNCYSFDINVSQGSGSSATLTLRVNDVDEESGELDEVYLNEFLLGYLSGNDGVWSTTSFNIASQIIYGGNNTVRICIDPDGGEATTWRAEIDWGQILIDGGSAEDADITSVSASGTWDAIQVQTGISATNTDTFRLEINLLDSLNNNKDIVVDTFAMTGGSSTTRFNTVSLPSEPSGSEEFTIEANLFNDTTGIQQSVKTTTWTYASEPPTDILLSNNHIDENLSALTLVGTLTAVDSDSVSHTFSLIGGDIGSFTVSGTELRTALLFDHEAQDNYSIHIEAEDEDANVYSEWFAIIVDDVNEAPTALNDDESATEGTTTYLDVLDDDTDPDDDVLDVANVTDPSKGVATIEPDKTIAYTPDPGACGVDSFSYTIEDGNGESDSASVTVTIQNVSPTAVDDAAETQEDESVLINVLANDSDPGSNPVIQSIGVPAHGSAVLIGDEVRYTPAPRFEGSDRISYTISDSCGATTIGWIDIEVLHTNHPPIANTSGFYQGVVGEPLVLDASFSNDPDISDTLQYRWDLNGSGVPNTGWLATPLYTAVYTEPFFGQLILEVRDVYRGAPTGEIAVATALVRIASIQSIQVFVFEDLDADGIKDPGEPGLPGIDISIAGGVFSTEADGGISIELGSGDWNISMTAASISNLASRGFTIREMETVAHLTQGTVETVTLAVSKTSTKLKGFVYVDLNENEVFDEDDDQLLQGLRVILDEHRETLTDDSGRYSFLSVPFGKHTLWIGENVETDEETDPENIPSLTVSVSLVRGERTELAVRWPWVPIGPEQGFLQVDVGKSENDN